MIQFLVFACLIVFAITYVHRYVYFKPVSAVVVDPDGVSTVSIKPVRSFFSRKPKPNGFVCLGSDFYAFYYCPSEPSFSLKYGNYRFDCSVTVFRIKRNRFVSVDYSDRVLNDIISKFIKEN